MNAWEIKSNQIKLAKKGKEKQSEKGMLKKEKGRRGKIYLNKRRKMERIFGLGGKGREGNGREK